MAIVFVGIDLAKNVFAVHAVDEHGKPALVRPTVARAKALVRLSGVGPTTATATLAMIGNGHEFRCGRQFAATPRQPRQQNSTCRRLSLRRPQLGARSSTSNRSAERASEGGGSSPERIA